MNNPEAFKEDEVRSIKFVVPGLPFGKQRPKVTVRKFTGSDGKEKKFAKAYTPEKTVTMEVAKNIGKTHSITCQLAPYDMRMIYSFMYGIFRNCRTKSIQGTTY